MKTSIYKKIKITLFETKSKIGYIHGFLTLAGSVLLAFLTMMSVTAMIDSDYALKIMPSMIATPIVISIYAIFILFSKTLFTAFYKIVFLSFIFIAILKVA